nr:ubiquitin carboxyl-terminal hydrolase 10 [Onthophagus taurus]
MDNIGSIEFLDLTGVGEEEKNGILHSLHAWNPKVEVPWKRSFHAQNKCTVPQNTPHINAHLPNITQCNGPPPNIIIPQTVPLIPSHQQPIYSQYSVTCYQPISTSATAVPHYSQVYPYPHSPGIPAHITVTSQPVSPIIVQSYGFTTNHTTTFTSQNQYIQNQDYGSGGLEEGGVEVEEDVNTQNGTKVEEKEDVVSKPPVKKLWASLFQPNKTHQNVENGDESLKMVNVKVNVQNVDVNNHMDERSCVNDDMKYRYDDPVYHRIGEFLSTHIIDHKTISLQPRGLINRSNYCYINSILQALLACPPVYNLLIKVADLITTNAKRKHIPVIDNMAKFVKEFQHLPAAQRVSRRVDKNVKQDPNSIINSDVPFEPGYIYKMLNGMRSDTFVVEGRQEDAEEFLGCLLNGLNDEMLELMKLVGKQRTKSVMEEVTMDDAADSKEWQVMGPKNKGCVTRRIDVVQTPLSDIFSGHLRSRLHRAGDKCTDNIQPFFTLQLNIEKVTTVRDALEALVCKNQLEGVTSSKTNKEVEAWQQVTIEELPYVLVLHLKCFDYKLDGCTKIIKALEFPIDLKLDSKLLSSKTNYSLKEKQYKLFAVVYHDGKEASKGHYLTDAYHVGYARWLRYDDVSVKPVAEEQVLKPHGTRVPYLLFYRRSDSIRSK